MSNDDKKIELGPMTSGLRLASIAEKTRAPRDLPWPMHGLGSLLPPDFAGVSELVELAAIVRSWSGRADNPRSDHSYLWNQTAGWLIMAAILRLGGVRVASREHVVQLLRTVLAGRTNPSIQEQLTLPSHEMLSRDRGLQEESVLAELASVPMHQEPIADMMYMALEQSLNDRMRNSHAVEGRSVFETALMLLKL